jgi:hypothetical protein
MVRMATFFLGNWVTRSYLAAVVAAAAFMIAANPITGPSIAAVFLIGLTAPVSIIFAPFFLLGDGWLTTPMLFGSVLAGYLLNTVLINMIVGEVDQARARRTWPARRPAAARVRSAVPVGQHAPGR